MNSPSSTFRSFNLYSDGVSCGSSIIPIDAISFISYEFAEHPNKKLLLFLALLAVLGAIYYFFQNELLYAFILIVLAIIFVAIALIKSYSYVIISHSGNSISDAAESYELEVPYFEAFIADVFAAKRKYLSETGRS